MTPVEEEDVLLKNLFVKGLILLLIFSTTDLGYQIKTLFKYNMALSTEDRLQYNFFPVASGQLQFRVKAGHDAHIALTTGPSEGEPMYEIFLGGWNNARSVIRKNRSKPEAAEADTPGILTDSDFRGFWIRWYNGNLDVGRENEANPFLSYTDPQPFGIGYFGVCTGWGATGEWIIEGRVTLKTTDQLKYNFHAVSSGRVEIEVSAPSNAHVALTQGKSETSPMYEVLLAGWNNTASVIRYDRKQPDKVRAETPNLLSANERKKFSISWFNGHIVVRVGGENGPVLMEWRDPNPIGISHVGVRTAWGATGKWSVLVARPAAGPSGTQHPKPAHPAPGFTSPQKHAPPSAPAPYMQPPVQGGASCWVDASGGIVPPGALAGGQDGEPLFVARARHEGALIPGKLKASHCVCYIPWGGGEHGKPEYQVLCGSAGTWVPTSGGNVPPNALPAGESEDGEPLFVGRVSHEGTLTIGKVQASHGVLYIPFGGAEVAFPDYEILLQ
ncbi:uncharacterized protein LOC124416394 isoform X1 [Diprion similis]|uniref:uncharacterized protein LOC124416394 isoform X1 n=1 Tax=Diprion similis TaxID=362088 RepID=UPI001EF8D1CD|nr:uncharacterized protein LOC124416394 isoform X1 [Diprion similis]